MILTKSANFLATQSVNSAPFGRGGTKVQMGHIHLRGKWRPRTPSQRGMKRGAAEIEILQISSNFALARSLSANQGREIAQNRNIDPRDIVVKDLTASRWSKHRVTDLGDLELTSTGPGAVPANVFASKSTFPVSGTFCRIIYRHEENQMAIGGSTVERKWLKEPVEAR